MDIENQNSAVTENFSAESNVWNSFFLVIPDHS